MLIEKNNNMNDTKTVNTLQLIDGEDNYLHFSEYKLYY